MATPKEELLKRIATLPAEPSGDKMMQTVVMTVGPGARMLELTRSGSARAGIEAWVDDVKVTWLTTHRSALMPVLPGRRTVLVAVSGRVGQTWSVLVTKPQGAEGFTGEQRLQAQEDAAEFRALIP